MQKCKAPIAVTLEVTPAPSTKTFAAVPQAHFIMITWTEETGTIATVFGEGKYHFTPETGTNFTRCS